MNFEECAELVAYMREQKERDYELGIVVSYFVWERGVAPLVVKQWLAKLWPEAADHVHLEPIDAARHFAMQMNTRLSVVGFLDGCVDGKRCGPKERLTQQEADMVLEEWDALNTPEQLPRTVVAAAMKRLGMA